MKKELDETAISSAYGAVFSQRFTLATLRQLPAILNEIHKKGKSAEVVSFLLWEAKYRCGLFKSEDFLNLRNEPVLRLGHAPAHGIAEAKRLFDTEGLQVVETSQPWAIFFAHGDRCIWGSLAHDECALYTSSDGGLSIVLVKRFPAKIKGIFLSAGNTFFVSILGSIHRSTDNGKTFELALELESAGSHFRHDTGMTETPSHSLIVGEYGTVWTNNGWKSLANLYHSEDEGASWEKSDRLIKAGINKHVHLVQYSQVLDRIVLTDGDNQKNLWLINGSGQFSYEIGWRRVNHFHLQMGGYTSMCELEGQVFLGTDYLGGTNFIVQTPDGNTWRKRVIPDPYRRSPVMSMVLRKSRSGMEIWALLHNSISSQTKSLLMYSSDQGESWTPFIEYDGTAWEMQLIHSSRIPQDTIYFSITDTSAEIGRAHVFAIFDH